jgi:hypothetical protein
VEEKKKGPGLTKLVERENEENVKAVFHFHHRGLRESSIKLLRARVVGEEGSEVEGKKNSGREGFYRAARAARETGPRHPDPYEASSDYPLGKFEQTSNSYGIKWIVNN